MQDLADSTTGTDTYSKLPSYLQPCNDSLIQSRSTYGLDDGVAVGYVTATIRIPQFMRSSHHRQISSSPDEPHLSDCRSPSTCRDDANKETLFRPINFDNVSVGMCRSLVPLTPPESSNSSTSGSSDRGSSNEDELDPPNVLLVRIPRRASDSTIVANNQPRCESKLKQVKASENEDLQLGLNSSGGQISQPHHGITINLLDKDLWKMFESIGNEMIVTKPGR